MKLLILAFIGAFAFRVIRNGFQIGSFKGWDSVTLSRALSSLVIALSISLSAHAGLTAFIIFWLSLWASFIPGINPETSIAITGASDSITQPLQWGIQWLSTKLKLPTSTFWQRKLWGGIYTMARFSVLIIPFTFLSFAISAPLSSVLGLIAPLLIAVAYMLAGFIPVNDQRVPAEILAGAIIGIIGGSDSMTDIKAFLKQWEGQRLDAYYDGAGIVTIGVGHKVLPEDNIQIGNTITQEQADAFLDQDIKIASDAVSEMLTGRITDNALCSLISLCFNIGVGNLRSSTLIEMLNKGYTQGAADQFLRWDKMHVNGEVVESQGLLNRRRAESALFLTPDNEA